MEATVTALELGSVALPDAHPRAADKTCPIRAFVIDHGDGLLLFDTGVGVGSEVIEALYRPTTVPIIDALNANGFDERDVVAIINSHLHFDHCGQNARFPSVPVYVQRVELETSRTENYTISEWAEISIKRQRLLDGDEEIADGVRVIATPGHSPGHQSVLVGGDLIVAQACYSCAEFDAGVAASSDMHDPSFAEPGAQSIKRLRELGAKRHHFSHDRTVG